MKPKKSLLCAFRVICFPYSLQFFFSCTNLLKLNSQSDGFLTLTSIQHVESDEKKADRGQLVVMVRDTPHKLGHSPSVKVGPTISLVCQGLNANTLYADPL